MPLDLPKEAIRALFASLSGINPRRVYWKGEPEQPTLIISGKAGKLTIGVVNIAEGDGLEPRREIDADDPNVLREEWGLLETITLSVRADNFVGLGTAYNLLHRMRFKFPLTEPRAQMRAADLAYVDSPSITQLDYVEDNREISSASMDVRFTFAAHTRDYANPADKGDAVPWIEKTTHQAGPFTDPEADALATVDLEMTRVSGTLGAISNIGTTVLEDLSGVFLPEHAGRLIRIINPASLDNEGLFRITEVVDAQYIKYSNLAAHSDAKNGHISWRII